MPVSSTLKIFSVADRSIYYTSITAKSSAKDCQQTSAKQLPGSLTFWFIIHNGNKHFVGDASYTQNHSYANHNISNEIMTAAKLQQLGQPQQQTVLRR